jgi:hypothetical protein
MKRLCVVMSMPMVAALVYFSLLTPTASAITGPGYPLYPSESGGCTPGDCETHACVPPNAQTCNAAGSGWGN